MQGLKTSPTGKPATSLAYRLPLLGLSALLAACHTPQADSAAGEQSSAANAITTTSQAAEQVATAPDQAHARQHYAPAATTAHTLIDEDGNPSHLDDSYHQANLRTEYRQCVAASGSHTSAINACMDEEFRWQRERMRAALQIIGAAPDSEFKDKLADEQDAYMRDTDHYCRIDPGSQGQGQLLDAWSCRINRYANRADVLEKLINKQFP